MEYNILSCGAVADGRTNCATAIQNAVDTASAAGGGRVIIPAGQYLSGSVLLKDNVELYLESGAVLISSLDPVDIKPFPQGGPPSRNHLDAVDLLDAVGSFRLPGMGLRRCFDSGWDQHDC